VACIAGVRGVVLTRADKTSSASNNAGEFVLKASWITGIISAAVVAGYTIFLLTAAGSIASVGSYSDPTQPAKLATDVSTAFSGLLSGNLALVFWLGAVVIGLAAPIALALLAGKKSATTLTTCTGIGLVCALVGGVCFRIILYTLGFSVFMLF
jgi:anaerobic dimethyl sulfoxide reductase subunit C (anchor subunit)